MAIDPSVPASPKRPLGAFVREWHSYISAFIAPMILFFAASGALQIFNLHESHDGYVAPAIVRAAARIHKEQMAAPQRRPSGERRPPEGSQPPAGAPPGGFDDAPKWSISTLALKWLFFLEACALVVTTLLGVWIGLTHAKRKQIIVALLIAGTVAPAAIIVWQTATRPS